MTKELSLFYHSVRLHLLLALTDKSDGISVFFILFDLSCVRARARARVCVCKAKLTALRSLLHVQMCGKLEFKQEVVQLYNIL